MKQQPPFFNGAAFTCPHCEAYAQMRWAQLHVMTNGISSTRAWLAHCVHCGNESIWWSRTSNSAEGVMVYPHKASAPPPHDDMPEPVLRDYEEARQIASISPRAAAALLRLCIEKLCIHLNAEGTNINAQIACLVRQGLPPKIAKAMDVVRVTGNNAVHPGQMDDGDIADACGTLFTLVNMIVEDRITRPRMVDEVYASLPPNALAAIERRDGEK